MDYKKSFSQHTRTMQSSLIRELVASIKTVPDLISFAGGFPSPKTFPVKQLAALFSEIIQTEGADVLQYGASEGDNLLKDELIKWEGYSHLTYDNMLITAGATNGIYYYTRCMIDEDDVILCEAPTFLGTLVAFDAMGAKVHGIPMDDEGIDLDTLKKDLQDLRAKGKKVKFLYTIPDFQNPTGITMSAQRRKDLIRFALDHDLPILEDNPYKRLRFTGEDLPTLYRTAFEQFRNPDIVTEIASFSKILGPGMRLAFAKGDKNLIERMCSWQQKVNISPDCTTERAVARFLQKGLMKEHLKGICEFYKPYLETMLEALEREMPSKVMWTRPEGGIFLWLWLPEKFNCDELFEQAREHKVAFIPGSKFFPIGEEQYNCMRLNFTYSTQEQINEGITRLAELIKSLLA
ncbi:MAG: PLP-dependent aminotransferase family protein [Candidatus Cloacimonadaceae bacterium]